MMDFFELLNLSTGLGYPMVSLPFAYNDKFTVTDALKGLAREQGFPEECISVAYGNRTVAHCLVTSCVSQSSLVECVKRQ